MPYGYKQPGNWKTTRKRILARDNHACYLCGAPADEVDHLINVAAGGTHDDHNLAAICHTHHAAKTKAERVAGQRRAPTRTRRTPEPHPGGIISPDA